jgi:DMSO/TMAO reductase YedYZ heme-binding membrane subunit
VALWVEVGVGEEKAYQFVAVLLASAVEPVAVEALVVAVDTVSALVVEQVSAVDKVFALVLVVVELVFVGSQAGPLMLEVYMLDVEE